jgi:hypothetical protein
VAKKNQLPVVGGIRKVITTPPASTPGTTIAEYGSGTVTLAQLRAALGVIPTKPNTQGGGAGNGATIALGPGLSGGGPVIGNVPIHLTAPIPVFIFEEGGGGDGDATPIPGQTGINGTTGAAGPMGPAIFLLADDPNEALDAIPGAVGPQGANSTVPGPIGPPVAFTHDDLDAELPFVPPSIVLRTVNKGANWTSSTAIVAASANIVYVNCPVSGTIQKVRLVTSGGPGSCIVDVWKAPFASFPPLVANSITASAKPTISAGSTYVDATLTGWTKAINAGDVLAFVISSASTFTQIQIVLEISQ